VDLLHIAKKFRIDAKRVKFLRKSHNTIYRVDAGRKKESFILRITSGRQRTVDEIAGELDFQLYLYQGGASVVTPLPTTDGGYILCTDMEGQALFITAFSWAEGLNWDERCDYEPEKLVSIGKELGKIHKLSMAYTPVQVQKRRLWSESQHLLKAPALFRAYHAGLYDAFRQCMENMHTLPADSGVFGLTHGDYLLSNYMIGENNRATVIDFDECEYSWYAADIAICMHCYLVGADPAALSSRSKDAETMLYNLLLGYTSETAIHTETLFRLQSFFKVRDFVFLSTILEKGEKPGGWDKSFLDTCLDRILNGRPFLDFDIERVLDRLN